MKTTIDKIIKINTDNMFFTDNEDKIINAYTNFYHKKIQEKIINSNYLDPDCFTFMNNGYAEIDNNGYPFDSEESKNFILNEKYKNFKYQVNLYKRLLDFAEIKDNSNIDVLVDLGCGKGGGVSFYKDVYKFNHCIGIDLASVNINLAKKHNKDVNFYVASAINLPINNDVVDVITCVESVLYYDPMLKFVEEVYRVLKNNGKILISADLNEEEEYNLENTFFNNGFILNKKEDITKNVAMGCAISKVRFMDISFSESEIMYNDEQKYYGKDIKYKNYKNFIFIKKGNDHA